MKALLQHHIAGSPVNENILWTNQSPRQLAVQLQDQGLAIEVDALRRILFDELGLARRQAYKNEASCHYEHRDEQFQHIARLRADHERRDWPVLSIDTKKKEILGNFQRPGRAITNGRVLVRDHDFAEQRLVPYGVFDTRRNEGLMYLARGADTCELVCDAIWRWWRRLGKRRYQHAPRMLLLCDCGGSNGYRQHRFKEELCCLAGDLRMDIQVAHYPPGCSKYNPIEHQLFCHVSRSLRGVVLKTIEVAQRFMAETTTAFGLRVVVEIARRAYEKGLKASPEFLSNSPIVPAPILPQLNYTAPGNYTPP